MKTVTEISLPENRSNLVAGIAARFAQIAIFFVLIAAILFLAAGRLDWIWAWVYLGISCVMVLINGTIMLRTSPETLAERGRPKETKDWDKVVSGLYALAMYIALPLVAGLDVRFAWTRDLNVWWNGVGVAMLSAGLGLGAWAMIANAYFSTAVRVQTDRGQTVCRTGPYRFVRHPGYLGFITQGLGTALLLGSFWALIPGFVSAALLVIRTFLEDRMLRAVLPGYADYVREVHYRLIAGIW